MEIDIEITFESHPVTYTQNLELQIQAVKNSIMEAYPGRLSCDDIEDVSDSYQEMLEYNWWCDEQKETLLELEREHTLCLSRLTVEQKRMYNHFREEE